MNGLDVEENEIRKAVRAYKKFMDIYVSEGFTRDEAMQLILISLKQR